VECLEKEPTLSKPGRAGAPNNLAMAYELPESEGLL
jgi:hypothetical protein